MFLQLFLVSNIHNLHGGLHIEFSIFVHHSHSFFDYVLQIFYGEQGPLVNSWIANMRKPVIFWLLAFSLKNYKSRLFKSVDWLSSQYSVEKIYLSLKHENVSADTVK